MATSRTSYRLEVHYLDLITDLRQALQVDSDAEVIRIALMALAVDVSETKLPSELPLNIAHLYAILNNGERF